MLLQRNATVYMLCRNKESTEAVIKEFKELTGKEARFIRLDLADLKSVKECAEELLRCVNIIKLNYMRTHSRL